MSDNRRLAEEHSDEYGYSSMREGRMVAKNGYGVMEDSVFIGDEGDRSEEDEDARELREQWGLHKTMSWRQRPSVMLVGAAMLAFQVAESSGMPSRSVILYQLACNLVADSSNSGTCDAVDAQTMVSNYALATSVLVNLVTMAVSTKIGQFSDNYGRTRFMGLIFILKLAGRAVQYYVSHRWVLLRFGLMVGCEIVCNLCGGLVTLMALANSYISDVVEPRDRTYSMGLGVAAIYSGTTIGPIIANILLSRSKHDGLPGPPTSSLAVGFTAAKPISSDEFTPLKLELVVLAVLSLYALHGLPESRSQKARTKSRTLSATNTSQNECSTRSIFSFLKPLWLLTLPPDVSPRPWRTRATVILLILTESIISASIMSLNDIFLQFGIYKFNWGSVDIAHLITTVSLSRAMVLVVVSPFLSKTIFQRLFNFRILKTQLDMIDFSTIVFGLVVQALCFFAMGICTSNLQFFAALIVSSLSTITDPSMNSTIVKFFPESKIGNLFGAISLLKNCFALVAPFIFQYIYKQSLTKFNMPGLVFLIFALLTCLGIIVLLINKKLLNLTKDTDESTRPSSVASISRNSLMDPLINVTAAN